MLAGGVSLDLDEECDHCSVKAGLVGEGELKAWILPFASGKGTRLVWALSGLSG